MKVFKILAAVVALALGASTFADAETLRTAPFPGYHLIEGAAHCAVVNGSGTGGQATLLLYDKEGNVLATDTLTLKPNQTGSGTEAFLSLDRPTFCKCVVPNATKWRCSFIYEESTVNAPMVIDAR